MDEDNATYFVHEITDEATEVVAGCDSHEKACRVLEGLSWLTAWESGSMSLPKKREKPMKVIFTPAKKKAKK